ncbi:MAG: hypothetical protein KF847_19705 [Pirellulales bacterium]|nr:hypothetical protein [Pirellulales bacterium]
MLLRRRRLIAAKIETVPGVAESLAGADAAFNAANVIAQPNVEFNDREGQAGFSSLSGVMGARSGQVTFDIELATDGSGGNPGWATTFLPACGVVNPASTTWSPRSMGPGGSGQPKTITIATYIDGVRKLLRGCMGNAVFDFTDGKPAKVSFTFTGIWDSPTDVALLAPTYPAVRPIRMMGATITADATALPPVQQFTLDLGNEVQMREDAANPSGYAHAVIVARNVRGSVNPEEKLVATRDIYGDWLAMTERSLLFQVGNTNNQIVVAVPKWQARNVQESERNGLVVADIEWQANRSASAGDDEITFTFA